jgi:hypothetical protein
MTTFYTPAATIDSQTLETIEDLGTELKLTASTLRNVADLLESGTVKNVEIQLVTELTDDTVHYYGNSIFGPTEKVGSFPDGGYAKTLEEAEYNAGYASRVIVDYVIEQPHPGRANRLDVSKLNGNLFINAALAIRPVVTRKTPIAIVIEKGNN